MAARNAKLKRSISTILGKLEDYEQSGVGVVSGVVILLSASKGGWGWVRSSSPSSQNSSKTKKEKNAGGQVNPPLMHMHMIRRNFK